MNDRSGRTVTRAGMGTPVLICEVRALNSFNYSNQSVLTPTTLVHSGTDLAKVHALDTLTTQRRTDRRTRRCLTGTDDELDELVFLQNCLGHDWG